MYFGVERTLVSTKVSTSMYIAMVSSIIQCNTLVSGCAPLIFTPNPYQSI